MEYCSVLKTKKYARKCMELEKVILREVILRKKHKYGMNSLDINN